jgi:hypothetical protein
MPATEMEPAESRAAHGGENAVQNAAEASDVVRKVDV